VPWKLIDIAFGGGYGCSPAYRAQIYIDRDADNP